MQTLRQSDKCFCQCQFWWKNMSILCKKNINFGRNVDFFIKCALLPKVIIFLHNMLIFRKMWVFVWRFIYINKVSNSNKNFNFLGYVNLFVLIFIKVFHLLENCYFDSKYHFVQWYFGQECHFPSKIYITLGINSLEKLSNFLRMVLI